MIVTIRSACMTDVL